MVAERHRLGRLKMGEAWHHAARMGERLACERQLQRAKRLLGVTCDRPHMKPEIGGHLVIARPRRVEPSGRRPDQLLEAVLDIEVNILKGPEKVNRPWFDLAFDLYRALPELMRHRRTK